MPPDTVPVFAIVGHPNEGKSSVVSTLSEDDTVPVSPLPGETRSCRDYPVSIDGREVVRFVDTPGFQSPRKTLAWFEAYEGPDDRRVASFLETHEDEPSFVHEVRLMKPLAAGSGIIYVVDGSRPVRSDDRAEMEILRLTGLPRIAIINSKEKESDFTSDWKTAFRQHFNAVRLFNAHRATYAERMALLEVLKGIDQDWEQAMQRVINALRADWSARAATAADRVLDYLEEVFGHGETISVRGAPSPEAVDAAEARCRESIEGIERKLFKRIQSLYRHNLFRYDLPEDSAVRLPLFSRNTWRVMGLDRWQLATAMGTSGGLVGAGLDVMAGGITFGVFTASGAFLGALSALLGGRQLARTRLSWLKNPVLPKGMKLGSERLTVKLHPDLRLFFVLLDRPLLYYSYVINWAHAYRDAPPVSGRQGVTASWSGARRSAATRFFEALKRAKGEPVPEVDRTAFRDELEKALGEIAEG